MKALLAAARAARRKAHAPYSKYKVGAALRSDDGRIYSGCNVENAAYPEGTCAEAGAIAAMVMGGGKRIREILVMGSGAETITPCGGCRQKIREFADPSTQVHLVGPRGGAQTFSLEQLLPRSFGPRHLGRRK